MSNSFRYYITKYNETIDINKDYEIAEDFYRRLFDLVYDWDSLINLNNYIPNAAGIDLYESEKGIGIQVTAQVTEFKSQIEGKINSTISKTIDNYKKRRISKIVCFFIKDSDAFKNVDEVLISKEYRKTIKIKTTNILIDDFDGIVSRERRKKIEELVKMEVESDFKGIYTVTNFSKINDVNSHLLDDYLFFNDNELRKINQIAHSFNENIIKEFAIIGNPCVGKTTTAKELTKYLKPFYKIFYLKLSGADNVDSIKKDIIQIGFYYSIIIIDNIQDNSEAFLEIRKMIVKNSWIRGLYLTRYGFKIENIKHYQIIKNDEVKISGIIDKRIYYFKSTYPDITWYKGDFPSILKNTNRNLLKLNIALKSWEKRNKFGALKLEAIDNNRILDEFYEEHKLSVISNQLTYLYAYLYSNEISFLPVRGYRKELNLLIAKGIIIKYNFSDFYYFPNYDYAELIYSSFNLEYEFRVQDKISWLKNYIDSFRLIENTQLNVIELITKLYYSTEKEVIRNLIGTISLGKQIQLYFNAKPRAIEVKELLKIVSKIIGELPSDLTKSYFELFKSYYKNNKLQLYVFDDYMVYTHFLEYIKGLDSSYDLEEIVFILPKNEKVNKSSIIKLTQRISKKKDYPKTVLKILNSFQFPEWFEMVNSLDSLALIALALSDLNKSNLSKKLVSGIAQNLEVPTLAQKCKTLKIDQIGKALREIEKIDLSIGTSLSKEILEELQCNKTIESKFSNINLSEYVKTLSDLSSIDKDWVSTIIDRDLKNKRIENLFFKEVSLSNMTARIKEIKKLFVNQQEYHKLANRILNSDRILVIISEERSESKLLGFYEIISSNKIRIGNQVKKKIRLELEDRLLTSNSIIELLTNPIVLRIKPLLLRDADLISVRYCLHWKDLIIPFS